MLAKDIIEIIEEDIAYFRSVPFNDIDGHYYVPNADHKLSGLKLALKIILKHISLQEDTVFNLNDKIIKDGDDVLVKIPDHTEPENIKLKKRTVKFIINELQFEADKLYIKYRSSLDKFEKNTSKYHVDIKASTIHYSLMYAINEIKVIRTKRKFNKMYGS